jgi:ion channel-forming bestrophin family protein
MTYVICFLDPFGYDKNDLNMDYYTSRVIRNELSAITSAPCPDPASWIFEAHNDLALAGAKCDSNRHSGPDGGCNGYRSVSRISPEEWIRRGPEDMMVSLRDIGAEHEHHRL